MRNANYKLMLIALYGAAFLAGFNENMVNMAQMAIMAEFGVDSVASQWLVTGYMIVATVVVMAMAYFYRKFKLRVLFFTAAGLSLAGSLIGLLSVNFPMLLAGRLVQAVGTGMFIPIMMNSILVIVPKEKMGTYLSIGGCMITFGPALAPVVCGSIVTTVGWHYIFAVPVIGMIFFGALAIPSVKNLENSEAHLDVSSVALSIALLFCLSYGLVEITLNFALALVFIALAILFAIAFVLRQLKIEYPLINLTPMKRKRFWPTILMTTVAMMSSFSCSVLIPLYFEGACSLTAQIAGFIMLVPVLGNCACTIFAGRLMDSKGEWPLLPAGFFGVTCGFAILTTTSQSLSIPLVFIGTFLVYACVGLVFSPSQTAGLRHLSREMNPHGVALTNTFVQLAACIGPSLYTGILTSGQIEGAMLGMTEQAATAYGFSNAMVVATIIALLGFMLAFGYSKISDKMAKDSNFTMPSVHKKQVELYEEDKEDDADAQTSEAGQPAAN